jgi:hypothetical protein
MDAQMINKVTERMNEMKKDVQIQQIMMQFETNEQAYEWLMKAAIATLMGVQCN